MARTSLSTTVCLSKIDLENKAHEPEQCPAFLALSLIANKWAIRILHALMAAENETLRFGQLQKSLGTITQRELTKQLREFEKSGLIERTVYPQIPPRVDYRLTALGHSLWQPIQQLSDWADQHAATIQEKRAAFAKTEKDAA